MVSESVFYQVIGANSSVFSLAGTRSSCGNGLGQPNFLLTFSLSLTIFCSWQVNQFAFDGTKIKRLNCVNYHKQKRRISYLLILDKMSQVIWTSLLKMILLLKKIEREVRIMILPKSHCLTICKMIYSLFLIAQNSQRILSALEINYGGNSSTNAQLLIKKFNTVTMDEN